MVKEEISPNTSKDRGSLWGSILAVGVLLGVVVIMLAQIPLGVGFTILLCLVLAAFAVWYGVAHTHLRKPQN